MHPKILLLALAVSALSATAAPTGATASEFAAPHRLVDIGGRRLNLACSGSGSPTVLFEAPSAAAAWHWWAVQPKIAAKTRACAYDRAGYGFSDPGPLPRHGAAIARDLDNALRAARLPGPYIVAGHSAGGIYAQLFAGRRRNEVVGLVLVDPSIIYQDKRMATIFGAGAGSVAGIQARVQRCLTAAEAGGAAVRDPTFNECVAPNASAETRREGLRPSLWRTQKSELDTLFSQTSDQRMRLGDLIRDVPTVVLTASRTGQPAPRGTAEGVWEGVHAALANEFTRGSQRLVKSGHLMMNERPDAVAQAIFELVDAYRAAPSR